MKFNDFIRQRNAANQIRKDFVITEPLRYETMLIFIGMYGDGPDTPKDSTSLATSKPSNNKWSKPDKVVKTQVAESFR